MAQDMGTINVPTPSPVDVPEVTVICCNISLDIAGARDFYDRLQVVTSTLKSIVWRRCMC